MNKYYGLYHKNSSRYLAKINDIGCNEILFYPLKSIAEEQRKSLGEYYSEYEVREFQPDIDDKSLI